MSRFTLALGLFLALAVVAVADDNRSAEAAYPGTNGRIAFASIGSDDIQHIWTMNPNGSDRMQLTNSTTHDDADPAWSPDGKRIVYLSTDNSSGHTLLRRRIFGTNDDDGIGGSANSFVPKWFPDGTALIVEYQPSGPGSYEIGSIPVTGGTITNLTNTADLNEYEPAVSPDGTKIAFVRDSGMHTDLWVMDVDGGHAAPLTETANENEFDPDWSPDGSKILFESESLPSNLTDIYVMNAGGGAATNLTNDSGLEFAPTFSPDGTMITYERVLMSAQSLVAPAGGPGAKYHIFMAKANGSDPVDISPADATSEFSPNWGVDEPASPGRLTWGDNDCSGGRTGRDALFGLLYSQLLALPAGAGSCPQTGDALQTATWGTLGWGDVDCSNVIDAADMILILRTVAGLPLAVLQDCPALGVVITTS